MPKQIISPADVLGKYKGRDVVRTTIAIRNAGDGLSDAMAIEPDVLEQGSTVYVVLECTVGAHDYVPLKDKGTDLGVNELKQVLNAGTATLIDAKVVRSMIEEQAAKVRVARSEALEAKRADKGELPLKDGLGLPGKSAAKKTAADKVTSIKKAAAKRAAATKAAPAK